MPLIVIDAGHGGGNPGASFRGRQEKDDTLALALAVGEILERNGISVYYTRTEDVYESPVQKALEGNAVNGDYFLSLHRNAGPYPGQFTGVESLVFSRYGRAGKLAEQINGRLERVGFANLGVHERGGLAVLRRTEMPAVLVEVGFINTEEDNRLLDERFDDVAGAIADGVLATLADEKTQAADREKSEEEQKSEEGQKSV